MTHEDRIADFIKLWSDYASEDADELVVANNKFMTYLENDGFMTAPASTKYHGAYEGGLYDHSKQVFLRLKQLTEDNDLVWQRDESPFIIGMFHDLCKCDQYKWVEDEMVEMSLGQYNLMVKGDSPNGHYEFNTNTLLKGHGSKSLMILSQFINLTEEEMLCIRYHMGAYGNDEEQKAEWAGFDKAIHKYPNVLWTHMADMLASKVDDV